MRWQTFLFRLVLAGLLLPAILLTLIRLTSPEIAVMVRLMSFAPVAVVLYAAALLLLVGKLVFPGRESSRAWLVVALVAAVGLGTHAWWLAPQFTGGAADPGRSDRRIQVMTTNLLAGSADPAQVIRTAALERVDVLVLQEVTPSALGDLEGYGLAEAYPYRAGEPRAGVKGTMVFSTYRIREVEPLGTAFDSWRMNVVLPEGELRLYAVHTSPPTVKVDDWHEDLELLAKEAKADRDLDVVAGDLNSSDDHAPFRELYDAGLRSAAERTNSGWQPTWPDHGKHSFLGIPLPLLVQIDHVLVGRSMTATATEAISISGSDHRAVVAEIAFR